MCRVAINGFGRIGRLVFRILNESEEFEVVAINSATDTRQLAYLIEHDSAQGVYGYDEVTCDEKNIYVAGKKIEVINERDPLKLPWNNYDIDLIFECSGKYKDYDKAMAHINAGAKQVLISCPAKGNIKHIVYGVNDNILTGDEKIVSAASCTTNCVTPVLKLIEDNYGIVKGTINTVHAYTNDQITVDTSYKKDPLSRRGRAAGVNIIPTSTNANVAIAKVIPSLEGKLSAKALRVPVVDGSIANMVLELEEKTSSEEINKLFKANQNDVLLYTEKPIVSSDVICYPYNTYGSVFDSGLTSVLEVDDKQLLEVSAWYDNEMGYASQMVKTAKHLVRIKK